MSTQFDLFDPECSFCNPTVCKCDPLVCGPFNRQCCSGACSMDNQASVEEGIAQPEWKNATADTSSHEIEVKLALAHRSIQELTVNVMEVLDTHARIDNMDDNIFLSPPKIDAETAQILYQKLLNIHELISAVRKSRKNVT